MCFFFSLIPATMLTVVGYFVLFSSSKIEGGVRLFGRVLAVWIFAIALMPPLAGAYVTLSGLCPVSEIMRGVN